MNTLLSHSYEWSLHDDIFRNNIIESKTIPEKDYWEPEILYSKLIFVIKGKISISYGKNIDESIEDRKILLLPAGTRVRFFAKQITALVILRISPQENIQEYIANDELTDNILATKKTIIKKEKDRLNIYYLNINNAVETYLKNLDVYIKDGIKNLQFLELKVKEVFFLLNKYYTKEELLNFFEPLLYNDSEFSNIVMRNIHRVKNVKELASLTEYSLSGFEKKFKKVFNMSAGKWIQLQRSKNIYYELSSEKTSLRNISQKNGFSSLSHFNNYCKHHFGLTPGKIRKLKAQ